MNNLSSCKIFNNHIQTICYNEAQKSYPIAMSKMLKPNDVDTAMFPFLFLTTNITVVMMGIPIPNATIVSPVTYLNIETLFAF